MEDISAQVQHHWTVALLLSEANLVTSLHAAPLPVAVLSLLALAWCYLRCAPIHSSVVQVSYFLATNRTLKVSFFRAFLFPRHKYRELM